ncbi:MAG: dephospho-CoA kinase [Bacteroidetes bacterium]|nr:dephospho-CoA kinase [Bacteroidota bacterium]
MKVGVTGGIGSGKTTVCRVFGILGVPVFDADSEARKIIDTDKRIQSRLSEIAGEDLYRTGSLDRKLLASLIFNNADLLGRVNSLIHPLVFSEFLRWASLQDFSYVIMEAAILFESGADVMVDKTITVAAPYEERIERAVSRSGLTEREIEDRVKNQFCQEDLIRRSDYVIMNGECDMIIPAVLEIHKNILKSLGS